MSQSNTASWRVLVVDDEPDSIDIVEMVLTASEATVYRASNGLEGLSVFKEKSPTIVLTDLSMPERDGWQFLKDIRKAEKGTHIPVIALTAHAMAGDRERVLKEGFDGYLSKPLRMMTLIKDIQAVLSNISKTES